MAMVACLQHRRAEIPRGRKNVKDQAAAEAGHA
jgi:hypothetical protein